MGECSERNLQTGLDQEPYLPKNDTIGSDKPRSLTSFTDDPKDYRRLSEKWMCHTRTHLTLACPLRRIPP